MSAIDLYDDFNEQDDALMGDFDDDDEDDNNQNQMNLNDADDQDQDGAEAAKVDVDPGIKPKGPKRKILTLNGETLKGPRGIIAIDDSFKNIRFKGKGHEKEDLNEVMKRLEHWCHRMFPKYHFDDALAKIERLGRKREISVHMQRYRLDQLTRDTDDNKVLSDGEDENMKDTLVNENPVDEFEEMLNQQIALSTTNHINATSTSHDQSFGNLSMISSSTQLPAKPTTSSAHISDEQRSKIEENRRRAMEIRAEKIREAEAKKRREQQVVLTQEVDEDEFDQLLQQQMEIQQMSTLTQDHSSAHVQKEEKKEAPKSKLTEEQRAKIEENRKRALALRAAKLKEAEEKKPKINIIIDDDFC